MESTLPIVVERSVYFAGGRGIPQLGGLAAALEAVVPAGGLDRQAIHAERPAGMNPRRPARQCDRHVHEGGRQLGREEVHLETHQPFHRGGEQRRAGHGPVDEGRPPTSQSWPSGPCTSTTGRPATTPWAYQSSDSYAFLTPPLYTQLPGVALPLATLLRGPAYGRAETNSGSRRRAGPRPRRPALPGDGGLPGLRGLQRLRGSRKGQGEAAGPGGAGRDDARDGRFRDATKDTGRLTTSPSSC